MFLANETSEFDFYLGHLPFYQFDESIPRSLILASLSIIILSIIIVIVVITLTPATYPSPSSFIVYHFLLSNVSSSLPRSFSFFSFSLTRRDR